MKPRCRLGKKADTTCPQWILDRIRQIREAATTQKKE